MAKLLALVKGDIQRLIRYNLLTANIVVLAFWVAIAWFLDTDIKPFLSLVFLSDAVMMNILLTGATIFYEKKEHTVNSILVSPVSEAQYLLSKILTSIINSLFTILLIGLAVWLVKGVTFSYAPLIPAIIVVSMFHTLLAVALTYGARDFTTLLLRFMLYALVFLIPSILGIFGVIGPEITKYMIAFPPEISAHLINTCTTTLETWKLIFGYLYLPALSALLYFAVVKPGFNRRIARESGV